MHWADKYAEEVVGRKKKECYTVESGLTPSGIVHAGKFREIITHDMVYRAIKNLGYKVIHQYFWDDYDRFRKVPAGVPKEWESYLGVPVSYTPDPWGCHKSYSEHFEQPAVDECEKIGIEIKFIYAYKEYEKCIYKDYVKTAIEKTSICKGILDSFRETPLESDWLPTETYCEKCNKDTTKQEYVGDYKMKYTCECGNSGMIDFSKKGSVKLRWRVDWPMRWAFYDVDLESSGKDHQSAGGSVDTGNKICKEVYNHEIPLEPGYNEIKIKGQGTKMSSSKGNVISISNLLDVYPPEIVRYMYTSKVNKPFDISFDLDLTNTYNYYDKAKEIYAKGEKKDEEYRKFELSQIGKPDTEKAVEFATCANIVQITQGNMKMAEVILKKLDHSVDKKTKERLELAWNWVQKYAPNDVKFTLLKELPSIKLDDKEKQLFSKVADAVKTAKSADDIQQEFYNTSKELNLDLKTCFEQCYKLFIGKEKGPRLGTFLFSLDRDFVISRLKLVG